MLKTDPPDAFMQVSGFEQVGERMPFVPLMKRPEQVFGIEQVPVKVNVLPGKLSRTELPLELI
jgi:hypothetical protein